MTHTLSAVAFRRVRNAALLAGLVGPAAAQAQVFTNLSGFGIGQGSATVIGRTGPVTDATSINLPTFPVDLSRSAGVNVATRGAGSVQITTYSGFDSGIINLQAICLAQGSSICDEFQLCGNGSATAGITTRAGFRVSEPAVLYLNGIIQAATQIDPAFGSAAASSTTTLTVVEGASTTLLGREVRSTTMNNLASETIPEGGIARLFPGVDYRVSVSVSGEGQSFGLNSSGTGTGNSNVNFRLFPPACPTVSGVNVVEHCASAPAVFSVSPAGVAPFTFQWQFLENDGFWYDLTNGFVAGVGTVSGAATNTLTVTNATTPGRFFRCRVDNDCGRAFSPPAVTVLVSSDFNHDGDVGTDQDIEAFFRCLAGACCPTCTANADFNGDGDVGTDADIESFFRVLAGGDC